MWKGLNYYSETSEMGLKDTFNIGKFGLWGSALKVPAFSSWFGGMASGQLEWPGTNWPYGDIVGFQGYPRTNDLTNETHLAASQYAGQSAAARASAMASARVRLDVVRILPPGRRKGRPSSTTP
jgi:hypothetical protein